MSVPNIVLYKKQALLTQAYSKLNISLDSINSVFGEVLLKNDLVDNVDVGDFVLFNTLDAMILNQNGLTYYLIDSGKIIFKEI